jgi:hypothetical protein
MFHIVTSLIWWVYHFFSPLCQSLLPINSGFYIFSSSLFGLGFNNPREVIGVSARDHLIDLNRLINWIRRLFKPIILFTLYKDPTSRAYLQESSFEGLVSKQWVFNVLSWHLMPSMIMHDVTLRYIHDIKRHNCRPEGDDWNNPTVIWREMMPI